MTLVELKQKCGDEGWDINKLSEKPARMYRVRKATPNGCNSHDYTTYVRRKCSTCKKEVIKNVDSYRNKNVKPLSGKCMFGKPQRAFCSDNCRAEAISGENHYMFEEGRVVDNAHSDYILVKTHIHPYRSKGNYVPQHRWIVEKDIGRYLKPAVRYKTGKKKGKIKEHGELVHHIDMDKKHNVLSNLMICNGMGHHQDVHATYNNICRQLMDAGIIGFSPDKGYYIIEH